MQVKFAVQTMSKDLNLTSPFQLDSRTYVTSNRILAGIGDDENKHWIKWLGSMKIDDLKKASTYVVTWKETKNPDVLDHENKELMERLVSPWYGLLFTNTKFSEWGTSSRFSGLGALEDGEVKISSIREISNQHPLERSFYESSKEYYDCDIDGDYLNQPALLSEWREITEHLDNMKDAKSVYSAFRDALESFREGRGATPPLTAIARLVECAEAIIALPKHGGGKHVFARRSARLLAHLIDQPYLKFSDLELSEELVRVYEIRNNRNHGKGMADQILEIYGLNSPVDKLDEHLTMLVGKSFYIAEQLAKSAIKYVISNHTRTQLMKNRATLEEAWANGSFI